MQVSFEPPAGMSPAQKEMIEKENHFRQLFAENPTSAEIQDPHLMLLNVFQNAAQFDYADEDADEVKVPKLLTQHRKLGLRGPAILSQAEFQKNWDEFTMGILNGLDWSNVFIAGGAVLGNISQDRSGYNSSDIDIFVYGIYDDEAANKKLRHIHEVVTRNSKSRGDVIRTDRAVTILNSYPYRHVQVVLRMYKSPAEVLLGFDIDSCTVGFDGKDVWCMPRFQRALTKRYNLVNISRRSLTYEQRLFKYSKRGFAVAVPNLDKAKVDGNLFTQKVRDVAGLAKLLLYDNMAQVSVSGGGGGFAPKRRGRKGVAGADDEEGSDYNGDLNIPWAPGLQVDQILRALAVKDRKQFFAKLNKTKTGAAPQNTGGRPTHLFERLFLDQPGQKSIEWIKNNPAYQDYDNGFRRQLMTGSFHPVVDENWEKGSYGGSFQATAGMLSTGQGKPAGSYGASDAGATGGSFPGMRPVAAKPSWAAQTAKLGGPSFSPSPYKVSRAKADEPALPAPSKGSIDGPATILSGGFSVGQNLSDFMPGGVAQTGFGTGFSSPKKAAAKKKKKKAYSDDEDSDDEGSGSDSEEDMPPKKTKMGKTAKKIAAAKKPGGFSVQAQVPASPGLSAFGPQPGHMLSPAKAASSAMPMPGYLPGVAVPGAAFSLPQVQLSPAMPNMTMPGAPRVSLLPPSAESGTANASTKILLLLSLLFKQQQITAEERGKLKDLAILKNELLSAALEVFELDQDMAELLDTLKRIVRLV